MHLDRVVRELQELRRKLDSIELTIILCTIVLTFATCRCGGQS